jgi:acyl dehydratase
MSIYTPYSELWGVQIGEQLPPITQAITQEFIDRYAASLVLRAWGAATQITHVEGKFTKPIFVGETITFTGVVTEVHPLGEGRDHLVVATTATDSGDDVVGVTTLSVHKPPKTGRPAEPGAP